MSRGKMRRLVFLPYWDECECCKKPLCFTEVNEKMGKKKSEFFGVTNFDLTYIPQVWIEWAMTWLEALCDLMLSLV